jgi:hypothetical protein
MKDGAKTSIQRDAWGEGHRMAGEMPGWVVRMGFRGGRPQLTPRRANVGGSNQAVLRLVSLLYVDMHSQTPYIHYLVAQRLFLFILFSYDPSPRPHVSCHSSQSPPFSHVCKQRNATQ